MLRLSPPVPHCFASVRGRELRFWSAGVVAALTSHFVAPPSNPWRGCATSGVRTARARTHVVTSLHLLLVQDSYFCCIPYSSMLHAGRLYHNSSSPPYAIDLCTRPSTSPCSLWPFHSTVTVMPRSSPFSFAYVNVPSSTVPALKDCFLATSLSRSRTAWCQ
jgi:hypothetical protein